MDDLLYLRPRTYPVNSRLMNISVQQRAMNILMRKLNSMRIDYSTMSPHIKSIIDDSFERMDETSASLLPDDLKNKGL